MLKTVVNERVTTSEWVISRMLQSPRIPFALLASVFVTAAVTFMRAQGPAGPPAWAYGVAPAGAPVPGRGTGAAPDDGSPKHIDGSTQAFTLAQVRDGFNVADWFPGDHPPAPAIVMTGRAPAVRACGFCHLANGAGRPENAGLAGLPVAYFTQQIADFRNDARKSAETRKTNTALMTAIAKAMTDEEGKAAAEYFAAISKFQTASGRWIRVVETATVPKTRIAGGMFVPLEGNETEPIGARIIEVPEHPDRTDLRDPRSGFVAYVPAGSIKRGEALVTTGGGRTLACGTCHGAALNGLGPVPGVAGRSPSYQVRQLYDMKAGTRKGLWTPLMTAVVANLTDDDLIAIGAYLASR
jgi:cytochrome c553